MKTPLTFLLSLTFLFLFSGSVYGDDLLDGLDAYQRKVYKEAVRKYRRKKTMAADRDSKARKSLGCKTMLRYLK